ncbi:MAG TPA: hypothetical protein VIZ28_06960 [Chitinophagaceae bacterium]
MSLTMKYVLWIAAFFLFGCSSSKKGADAVWVNPDNPKGKTYSSVFITAVTADPEARVAIENDLAKVATDRGLRAVKSTDVITIDIHNPRVVTKEEVIEKVIENKCESVFTVALLKKEETAGHVQGGTAYAQSTYYSWNSGYYTNLQQSVYVKDYYTHDKTYYLQTNFYDAASKELAWTAKSTVFTPETIKEFSRSYCKTLIDQLQKAKVIKKQ